MQGEMGGIPGPDTTYQNGSLTGRHYSLVNFVCFNTKDHARTAWKVYLEQQQQEQNPNLSGICI